MGSYLEIDGNETNSKYMSSILIDAIRFLDNEYRKEELNKSLFEAEYYKDDIGGCGGWVIKRKGVALLAKYLKYKMQDTDFARELGIQNHKYYLDELCEDEKKPEEIERFTKNAISDIQWCYMYVSNVLVDMVLEKNKIVVARWV